MGIQVETCSYIAKNAFLVGNFKTTQFHNLGKCGAKTK